MSNPFSNRVLPGQYWLALILSLTVLTRLPFLWSGYGADADAWLVANSAQTLWTSGIYLESRLPGYPLHEIVSAPFVSLGGAMFSNGATLAATLFSIVVWYRIALRHGRHKALLVLAFAFAPSVWQNSAVTLDYMWSLLFILISLFLTFSRRYVFAGIALGIAAGFRPSNLAAVIPLACLIFLQEKSYRQLFLFSAAAATVTLFAFLPLISKYGIPGWFIATREEMSDVHPKTAMRFIAFFYRTVYFIGPLAATTGLAIFWKRRAEIAESIHAREPLVVASIAACATFLSLFLWLPLERAYLLPVLPFLLLLGDRFFSKRMFLLFTVLLLFSGLINLDIIKADDRRAFGINLHWGMVIEELQNRKELFENRKRTASLSLPNRAVVMTSAGPAFWFENDLVEPSVDNELLSILSYTGGHFRLTREKLNPQVNFAAFVKRDEVKRLRQRGFEVYCFREAEKYVTPVAGYTMDELRIPLVGQ